MYWEHVQPIQRRPIDNKLLINNAKNLPKTQTVSSNSSLWNNAAIVNELIYCRTTKMKMI